MEEKEKGFVTIFRTNFNMIMQRMDELSFSLQELRQKVNDMYGELGLIKDVLIKLLGKFATSKTRGYGWSDDVKSKLFTRIDNLLGKLRNESDKKILRSFRDFLNDRGFLTKKQMELLRKIEGRARK